MLFDIHPARDRKVLRRSVVARCEAVLDRDFRLLGRTLRDLSPDGAFVETDLEVALGEEIYLSIQLPRTRVWIDAIARVVRLSRGRREGGDVRGVGVRFEVIDGPDRAILVGSLAALPPPRPKRPIRADYAASVLAVALGLG
jgi:hypothetical protein